MTDGGRAAAARWASVERLLDRALDLAPAERAAFVAREAAHDPALRAEVEALLARCNEMLTFLDEPAAEFAAPLLAASLADPAAPVRRRREAPARVGPYRVLRELGRGGMGVVYLAERDDAPPPQRPVALKVLPAEAGVANAVRRFHVERRILASLDHPNVARLLDGGVAPDGTPWFSMELVDGLPIDRWCDERGLDVDARLRLFLDVCAVVRYAHERRIVHRDLKPSNILVRDDGSPTLLDFGIAKLLDGDGAADGDTSAEGRLTRTGVRVLTPGYASPEQVRGEPVSPASDVYALGVLLHELLVGHGPYGDDRPDARELQRRVLEHEPARPSSLVADRRLRRRLRGDLDAVVLAALRKDPARRYASVEQLADDLRRHLAGKRVAARRRTTRDGALRYDSRMRTSILVWSAVGGAVVGLIVAALVVGAAVLLHLVLPAAPARLLARTAPLTIPLVVALLALAGAVLGYLEGRLKL